MLAANVACGLSLGEYTALTFAGAIRQARCLIMNLHGTPKLHPGAKVSARHAFCLSKHSPTFACSCQCRAQIVNQESVCQPVDPGVNSIA